MLFYVIVFKMSVGYFPVAFILRQYSALTGNDIKL